MFSMLFMVIWSSGNLWIWLIFLSGQTDGVKTGVLLNIYNHMRWKMDEQKALSSLMKIYSPLLSLKTCTNSQIQNTSIKRDTPATHEKVSATLQQLYTVEITQLFQKRDLKSLGFIILFILVVTQWGVRNTRIFWNTLFKDVSWHTLQLLYTFASCSVSVSTNMQGLIKYLFKWYEFLNNITSY